MTTSITIHRGEILVIQSNIQETKDKEKLKLLGCLFGLHTISGQPVIQLTYISKKKKQLQNCQHYLRSKHGLALLGRWFVEHDIEGPSLPSACKGGLSLVFDKKGNISTAYDTEGNGANLEIIDGNSALRMYQPLAKYLNSLLKTSGLSVLHSLNNDNSKQNKDGKENTHSSSIQLSGASHKGHKKQGKNPHYQENESLDVDMKLEERSREWSQRHRQRCRPYDENESKIERLKASENKHSHRRPTTQTIASERQHCSDGNTSNLNRNNVQLSFNDSTSERNSKPKNIGPRNAEPQADQKPLMRGYNKVRTNQPKEKANASSSYSEADSFSYMHDEDDAYNCTSHAQWYNSNRKLLADLHEFVHDFSSDEIAPKIEKHLKTDDISFIFMYDHQYWIIELPAKFPLGETQVLKMHPSKDSRRTTVVQKLCYTEIVDFDVIKHRIVQAIKRYPGGNCQYETYV